MKVTTEKIPNGRIALDIELDEAQVQKGLDRAARRLSKEMQIPGFRKGKAPRFIIERYFGKEALFEEASGELMNKAFEEAIKAEEITPVGKPDVEAIDTADGFRFRVIVPIPPTVTIPDYTALSYPLEEPEPTEEMITYAMEMLRDKHVALRELDEPRPAAKGDLAKVLVNIVVEGKSIMGDDVGIDNGMEQDLILEESRIIPELYAALVGAEINEEKELTANLDANHPDENLAGKEGIFQLRLVDIQERVLPDWDELPEIEEYQGTLEELRQNVTEKIRVSLISQARAAVYEQAINHLIDVSEYDIADVSIEEFANSKLKEFEQKYAPLGITAEQIYTIAGKDRQTFFQETLPEAEHDLKESLILLKIAEKENLVVEPEDINLYIGELVNKDPNILYSLQDPTIQQQYVDHFYRVSLENKAQQRLVTVVTGKEPPSMPDDVDHIDFGDEDEDFAYEDFAVEDFADEDFADDAVADQPAGHTPVVIEGQIVSTPISQDSPETLPDARGNPSTSANESAPSPDQRVDEVER